MRGVMKSKKPSVIFAAALIAILEITAPNAASALSVSFVAPTPENGAIINYPDYAYLNASIIDAGERSTAFINCDNSLVGWWRFNNETGENSTFFRDWSGYGNDAMCIGSSCPNPTSGMFGKGLQFDEADDYLTAINQSSLNTGSQLTVESWIYTSNASDHQYIIGNGRDCCDNPGRGGYGISIYSQKLRGEIWLNSSKTLLDLGSSTSLRSSTWYHVAMIFTGTEMILYVNGKEDKRSSEIPSDAIQFAEYPLRIGALTYYAPKYYTFGGIVDEIKIWNRVLTPEEIKRDYGSGKNARIGLPSYTNKQYVCAGYVQDRSGNINKTEDRVFNMVNDGIPRLSIATGHAITDAKLLPQTDLSQTTYRPGGSISIQAAPGEYEAASFSILSNKNVTGLKITAVDLTDGANTIPAKNIDIKAVNVWWQAGTQVWDSRKNISVLSPELLLHDDALVIVEGTSNFIKGYNCGGCYVNISHPHWSLKFSNKTAFDEAETYLEETVKPEDSEYLQPVNIRENKVKQFWITLYVPNNSVPGKYSGTIALSSDDLPESPENKINLDVEVLPFSLDDSLLEYSAYYRSVLSKSTFMSQKSGEQVSNEMIDMASHGIDNPTIYQPYTNLSNYLSIRENKGFKKDRIYHLGITNWAFNSSRPAEFEDFIEKYINISLKYGYNTTYIYGRDEARGENLTIERPAFEAVHKAGAKNFVACYANDCFSLAGDLLDTAVLGGALNSTAASQFHSIGHKVLNYGNPQFGIEQPETYRRNYGLLLWDAGYDGAMDYAYQGTFEFPWNDYDDYEYRDHMMTYPTQTGVIDTIQWEGFREGVDDVRYLSTLLKYINLSKSGGEDAKALGAQAEEWIHHIDFSTADLYEVRAGIIERIKGMQSSLGATPAPSGMAYIGIKTYFYSDGSVAYANPTAGKQRTEIRAVPAFGNVSILADKYDAHQPAGELSVNFTADSADANSVVFTVVGMNPDSNYIIRKDGMMFADIKSDTSGMIVFNNSAW